MQSELEALIAPAVNIAKDAGSRIMGIYETDFQIETKADNSPLTTADKASHNIIVCELKKLTPDIPILSEESIEIPYAERSKWDEYWLIDPLDGTREFIARNGEFTVNIALIRNHKPVLGVVHVPARDQDYFGHQGVAAFKRDAEELPRQIRVTTQAHSPVRVVGSRSHRAHSLDRYLNNLGDHVMVPMGSSLKLCLVAAGEADVYPRLGPTSEWDIAAAHAVVDCAGGHVTGMDGQAIQYNTKSDVLNPHFIVFGDVSRDWTDYA
jgi:3'(2'), 5'-bisphosphate nucleotidase